MSLIKNYRPLPNSLTIKRSKIHGIGLFATKKIPEETNLGVSHIISEHKLIRTPLGGFINHSLNPNCYYQSEKSELNLVTVRVIKAGEELTVDYTGYYESSVLESFR